MNRSLWITWNLIFCWLKVWLNQVSRGVWCIASQCGAAKGWSPGKNRPKDRRIDESCLTKHLYLALPRRPEKNRRKQAHRWQNPLFPATEGFSFMVADTDGSSTVERRKIFMNENEFAIDTIMIWCKYHELTLYQPARSTTHSMDKMGLGWTFKPW